MKSAFRLQAVTKQYPSREKSPGFILGPLNLELPSGCILGLIGENGAGKTTTLKMMLGLTRKSGGHIELLGRPAGDETLRAHIGAVMDGICFPGDMNARQVGRMLEKLYPSWRMSTWHTWCRRFHLPEEKKIAAYSKGMQQKLMLAAAFSHDSRLLLLDEATSGLDPVARDELLDTLRDFVSDENHSVLLSSHLVEDVQKVCDYVALLHEGQLLFCEEKDRLLESFALVQGPREVLLRLPGLRGMRENAFGATALVPRIKVPSGLSWQPAGLEDIMLYTLREDHHERTAV